eukprot:7384364-Prymnesium_polylepis.2
MASHRLGVNGSKMANRSSLPPVVLLTVARTTGNALLVGRRLIRQPCSAVWFAQVAHRARGTRNA